MKFFAVSVFYVLIAQHSLNPSGLVFKELLPQPPKTFNCYAIIEVSINEAFSNDNFIFEAYF